MGNLLGDMCCRIKTRETVIGIDEPCDECNNIIPPPRKVFKVRKHKMCRLFRLCFRQHRNSNNKHTCQRSPHSSSAAEPLRRGGGDAREIRFKVGRIFSKMLSQNAMKLMTWYATKICHGCNVTYLVNSISDRMGSTLGFARIIIPTTACARPTATDPETTTAPAQPRYPVV